MTGSTADWIRFWISVVLLFSAMTAFTAAAIGANRFGFVMNRMHAAGIGDTFGVLCIFLAVVIANGAAAVSWKMTLIIVFLWFTSPTSSHILSQIEYYTNPHLFRYMDREEERVRLEDDHSNGNHSGKPDPGEEEQEESV